MNLYKVTRDADKITYEDTESAVIISHSESDAAAKFAKMEQLTTGDLKLQVILLGKAVDGLEYDKNAEHNLAYQDRGTCDGLIIKHVLYG